MFKYLAGTLVLLVAIIIFFKFSKTSIEGNWQAVLIIDNHQDTLNIALDPVQLLIQETGYTFNSTLKQTESGRIEHLAEHIVLYPSSGHDPYKIQIVHLDEKSLILDMIESNVPRRIHFQNIE